MKSQAVWFVAPRVVSVREVEVAKPTHDHVAVRTLFSGISSGTELLAYRGQLDAGVALDEQLGTLRGSFAYPFRYGYSCVGIVERSTALVDEGSLVFAFHPHQERFVVPAESVIQIEGIEPREATLFPLVETALQVSLDADPTCGDLVVVLGLGAIGLLTALLLMRAGAEVVGAEPQEWRRTLASSLGVQALAPNDLVVEIDRRTGRRGVPVIVDASGNPAALAPALDLLQHEGIALVASWFGNQPVPLPLGGAFHRRRLTIRSTQVSTIPATLASRWTLEGRRATTGRLLGELPLAALATHAFPLARAADAYRAIDRAQEGLLHAALCYA